MRVVLRCRLALSQRQTPRGGKRLADCWKTYRRRAGTQRVSRLFLAQGFVALKSYDRALEELERVRRADRDSWEALGLEAANPF